uniref:Cytochrome P450 monooxygenase n=1 Tax=Pieris rapae TaxID=64459 RepID=A0A1V0D9G5_PIERA|nr:cytochrome P450 monooxygenase [Pieris rapae]
MQPLEKLSEVLRSSKNCLRFCSLKGNETVHSNFKSWKEIPGPYSLPIIGQTLHFLPGGSLANREKMLNTLYDKFGPIVRLEGKFGAPTLIFILDADAAAHILRSENWMPVRPGFKSLEYYRKKVIPYSPDQLTGLLTDHGEPWKKFRSIVNPIMMHSKTIKLYSKILNEVSHDTVNRMKYERNEKNAIENIDDVISLWALETIGVVALGGRINCLDLNLPEDSPARRLIQIAHDIFVLINKLDFRPSLWRYISTRNYRKLMNCYAEQKSISEYFIKKAMEEYKSKERKDDEEKSVLEKLLEIDEKVAVIMATDLLFAGVDTSAHTMLATLYLLAKNKEKQEKLRQEILSQDEKKPYLKACIKESLRVMPIVAGNLRMTTKDYNILGYNLPKNTLVTFAHQFLSTSEQHFLRSKEFIPERWLVDKTDPLHYGRAHPFACNPFGFGVRSCLGRRIAELELEILISNILKNFRVDWIGPPAKTKVYGINYVVGPYYFLFEDL